MKIGFRFVFINLKPIFYKNYKIKFEGLMYQHVLLLYYAYTSNEILFGI